ncbi:MAG TPA: DNA recombination protein RmuC [Tepidisphaeraceae bacterium]|jgi:DNA recombination protein RmuC|nr:DNA recombination protein RmuC [Tepidisphaeraceae bacterium]
MEVVAVIVGILIGGVVGWLIAERRATGRAQQHVAAATVAESRVASLTQQLADQGRTVDELRERISLAERSTATAEASLRAAEDNIAEQRKLLDDAQAKLRDAFASVSTEALAKNNQAFLDLAKERFATLSQEATGTLDQRKTEIDGMLKPMQELLGQYQTRLVDIEKNRVESYSMLREQLGTLMEVQRTANHQTNALVTALRRPTTRGQWGEVTLRRLVELAGMTNRCDFFEQTSQATDDGNKQRPDMVVRLPGGREIVIDCKAVLDGFLDAVAATSEDSRRECLSRHSAQVRSRARDLSMKAYWSQFKRSPEFIVMFLPGEAFFSAAIESDPGLYEDMFKSRVIIATPTTLLALLRSVEYGWRQEDMTENAEKIRKLGVDLYERVRTLAEHMSKIGNSLGTAVGHYNNAVGSLETRVLVSARKMGELGARTEKEMTSVDPLDSRPRELTTATPAAMITAE